MNPSGNLPFIYKKREFIVVDWYYHSQLPVLNPTAPTGMKNYLENALGVKLELISPNDTYYIIDEHVKYPDPDDVKGRAEEFKEVMDEAGGVNIEFENYQLDLIIAHAVDRGILPNVDYLIHVSW